MDKAKEISKDYADQHTCYANDPKLQYLYTRKAVEFGYQQAEKDLELTWEDMETIQEIANNYTKYHTMEPRFFVYKEVLKRFKEFKEKKGR